MNTDNRLVSIPEAREEWLGGIGNTTIYELVNAARWTRSRSGEGSLRETDIQDRWPRTWNWRDNRPAPRPTRPMTYSRTRPRQCPTRRRGMEA